jgi:2-polyprenyl-3-methyl-5-hydroxy-6-metoxy-1,4-benzoquinol methylase
MKQQTIRDQFLQRVRSAYYAFDALRELPLAEHVGRKIHAWETERGFGDSPKDKNAWDNQYARGDWEYMSSLQESSRYSAIVGYISLLRGEGALLDVGCGEGILYERIKHLGCSYTGLDISQVAVGRLQSKHADESASFLVADADEYQPTQAFDLVVLNESLYYLQRPLQALQRYAEALKPDGALIVSTYTRSRRAKAILRDVKRAYLVVDETTTMQGSQLWLCTVLRPR